jgi:hypothetical protein
MRGRGAKEGSWGKKGKTAGVGRGGVGSGILIVEGCVRALMFIG